MQANELVVLPLKTTGTIAVGRVSGPYVYRDDLGSDFRHARPVTWTKTTVPRDDFDQDLLYSFGAFLTVGQVRRENAEAPSPAPHKVGNSRDRRWGIPVILDK